jgi:hypothetical protein
MFRMKRLSISEDQIDAILPIAGTLAALIVLLVVLVVSADIDEITTIRRVAAVQTRHHTAPDREL